MVLGMVQRRAAQVLWRVDVFQQHALAWHVGGHRISLAALQPGVGGGGVDHRYHHDDDILSVIW